jgi:hypothetical protein
MLEIHRVQPPVILDFITLPILKCRKKERLEEGKNGKRK